MGINRILLFLLLVNCALGSYGQERIYYFEIKFTDKNNTGYELSQPSEFLTERAISRRIKQNLSVEPSDLPINSNYIQAVLELPEVDYVTRSKWFNHLIIGLQDTSSMAKLRLKPFVRYAKYISGSPDKKGGNNKSLELSLRPPQTGVDKYGLGYHQIAMLNGNFLHELGYEGEGMLIAVIDGGFYRTDSVPALAHLYDDNKILSTYDFVNNDNFVYHRGQHGTFVLSTMAAKSVGVLVGSASEAEYLLLISEDPSQEIVLEEYFWVAAAEYADSLGADVFNTSLGYTRFENDDENHTYEDMDGNTTIITRASDLAARKGILVVNSAGNSGNGDWKYIGAPADGDSVLSIGAVDSLGRYAKFSSIGPTADGRIKPNVMAQGQGTYVSGLNNIFKGSGTSLAGPIITGMAACLWQSNPALNNMEVFHAIEQSANLYLNPSDTMGYGIPDFGYAFFLLNKGTEKEVEAPLIFPNPFQDKLYVLGKYGERTDFELQLFNYNGIEVFNTSFSLLNGGLESIQIPNELNLPAGLYTAYLDDGNEVKTVKLIKN